MSNLWSSVAYTALFVYSTARVQVLYNTIVSRRNEGEEFELFIFMFSNAIAHEALFLVTH